GVDRLPSGPQVTLVVVQAVGVVDPPVTGHGVLEGTTVLGDVQIDATAFTGQSLQHVEQARGVDLPTHVGDRQALGAVHLLGFGAQPGRAGVATDQGRVDPLGRGCDERG